jgi:hypothetical protein
MKKNLWKEIRYVASYRGIITPYPPPPPKKTVLGTCWPFSELFITVYSFSVFLWRRRVAFPSRIGLNILCPMRVSLVHCSPVSWAAKKVCKFIANWFSRNIFFNFLHPGINLVVGLTCYFIWEDDILPFITNRILKHSPKYWQLFALQYDHLFIKIFWKDISNR